jgi:outer membrane protein OmpA-like peptidoglycan-associated protein
VTKLIGVSLEVNANSKEDRFNSKTNNSDDWQFTAMLGLSVRFGKRYQKTAPAPAPVVQDVVESAVVETAPASAAVVVKKKVKKDILRQEPVKLHKEIFYAIRNTQAEREPIMVEIANFVKQNKDAKVSIVGYADKGTGNPKINMKYATNRANKFKEDLVKLGVPESCLTVDSKGDTVQPFAENDKNRCVIVDGTATREYTETIEVEE